jgi:hypothetical protein
MQHKITFYTKQKIILEEELIMKKNDILNQVATNITIEEPKSEGGFKHITGNLSVDTFIIPNSAAKLNEFWGSDVRASIVNLAVDNDVDFSTKRSKAVEVWHVANTSDNVCSHGVAVKDEASGQVARLHLPIQYIPADLFKGKKEGDVVTINVKCIEGDYSIDITLSMSLNQENYRYARFGKFQDVLKKVC